MTTKKLERGQDKIDKLCKILREETLEPAHEEGLQIVAEARLEAKRIIEAAEEDARQREAAAKAQIEKEQEVFHTSMKQACRQALEALRQAIENKLFNEEFDKLLSERMRDPQILTSMISTLIKAVEQGGVDTDFAALIPAKIKAAEINTLLADNILKRLQKESVEVGSFIGGVRVKLLNSRITMDFSTEALKELLAPYLRKDFRELLFGIES